MKISIAMITYQGEPFLKEALDSILHQSRLPDELVVSDDFSTDKTCEIISKFSLRATFPVRLLNHNPSGITENYLNAVKNTSGDIIITSDQDDVWIKDKIRIIEHFFRTHPEVVIASSDSMLVDEHLKFLGRTLRGNAKKSRRLAREINGGDDFLRFLRGGLPLLAHTLSFRSEIIPALINKPKQIPEWWFEEWASYVGLCSGRLGFISESLTLYRQHNKQHCGVISSAPVPGFELKIHSRLEKLKYCLSLISEGSIFNIFNATERRRRAEILGDCIDFLNSRSTLISKNKIIAIFAALRILLAGKYNRFAHGFLSFGSDLLCILKG